MNAAEFRLLEALEKKQDEQGVKIDALVTGMATLNERLADYPVIKAQVFKWRDSFGAVKSVAAWVAGLATFGGTIAGLIHYFQ
jgi:hypothetical protein